MKAVPTRAASPQWPNSASNTAMAPLAPMTSPLRRQPGMASTRVCRASPMRPLKTCAMMSSKNSLLILPKGALPSRAVTDWARATHSSKRPNMNEQWHSLASLLMRFTLSPTPSSMARCSL